MKNAESLDDLFHRRVFHIPDYQRDYSWETLQVQEFLSDLEVLGSEGFHYTGTVVLHAPRCKEQTDEDGKRYTSVAIVDGQQRLTTIILLIDGISKLFANASGKADRVFSTGIRKNFIAVRANNGEYLYKLTLNTNTDHFFKTRILSKSSSVEGPQVSSQKRLESARDHISKYLQSNFERQKNGDEWLRTLYAKIAHQLRFTIFEVENQADAGIIFEVMNDRGKPLTELEKVKNFLWHASVSIGAPDKPNQLTETVNGAWAAILGQLMSAGLESSADEDRLLRAHWLTHYDPQPRNWNGSKSVKDRFALRKHQKKNNTLLRNLHDYTEQLRQDCVAFCDILSPNRVNSFQSFKNNKDARLEVIEWSEKLVRMGVVAPFLPLLLAARIRGPRGPSKYLELLKLCEAFAFRVYRVVGWRSDAGQSALFSIAHSIETREVDYPEVLKQVKSELVTRCSPNDFSEFTNANEPDDRYGWSGLQYFLYEYEIALARERGVSPKVRWDELRTRGPQHTIEHILPQSIDNQPYWQNRFDADEHEMYVHDLGNLTLTKHNSHYSNKPFPEKKGSVDDRGRCYAKSPLFMEQELTRWKQWNADSINSRRRQMLEWAKDRWKINSTSNKKSS